MELMGKPKSITLNPISGFECWRKFSEGGLLGVSALFTWSSSRLFRLSYD